MANEKLCVYILLKIISILFSGSRVPSSRDNTRTGGPIVPTNSSVLTSRKSSSTPSLPEATENVSRTSVASTEQAASADNLAAKVCRNCFTLLVYII